MDRNFKIKSKKRQVRENMSLCKFKYSYCLIKFSLYRQLFRATSESTFNSRTLMNHTTKKRTNGWISYIKCSVHKIGFREQTYQGLTTSFIILSRLFRRTWFNHTSKFRTISRSWKRWIYHQTNNSSMKTFKRRLP